MLLNLKIIHGVCSAPEEGLVAYKVIFHSDCSNFHPKHKEIVNDYSFEYLSPMVKCGWKHQILCLNWEEYGCQGLIDKEYRKASNLSWIILWRKKIGGDQIGEEKGLREIL